MLRARGPAVVTLRMVKFEFANDREEGAPIVMIESENTRDTSGIGAPVQGMEKNVVDENWQLQLLQNKAHWTNTAQTSSPSSIRESCEPPQSREHVDVHTTVSKRKRNRRHLVQPILGFLT